MYNIHNKISALAIFAPGNTEFTKTVHQVADQSLKMETLLFKIVAGAITKAFKSAAYDSQPSNSRKFYNHNSEYRTPAQELPFEDAVQLTQRFFEQGYEGSEIRATYYFNAGQKRYTYTFFFD